MKSKLMIGMLAATLGGAVFASNYTCSANGYEARLSFPGRGGMGETRGTGRISLNGKTLQVLNCVYATGITTSINCGGPSGYEIVAGGSFTTVALYNHANFIADLDCK